MTSGDKKGRFLGPISKVHDSVLAWLNSQDKPSESPKSKVSKSPSSKKTTPEKSKRCGCHAQTTKKNLSKIRRSLSSSLFKDTVSRYALRSSKTLPLQDRENDNSDSKSCSPSTFSDYGSLTTNSSSFTGALPSFEIASSSALGSTYKLDAILSDEETQQEIQNARVITYGGVRVVIPSCNKSGYSSNDFALELIYDPYYAPKTRLHKLQASEVVSVEPHGTTFYKDCPARIFIPVRYELNADDDIICLYSNTSEGQLPHWEPLPPETYRYSHGYLEVIAEHFSLFTVVIRRRCPEVRRRMGRHGGRLRIGEFPGLEVYFPPSGLHETIEACVKLPHEEDCHQDDKALASPIVMVGPHGYQFNPGSHPVIITIPIPDYDVIVSKFGSKAKLTVWQSATAENEPLNWEPVDVDTTVAHDEFGNATISFPVDHFSFFKALWDILACTLYEAKLGVSFFHPYVTFSMMCQAWMEENRDTLRFGLEIICYRSDKKLPEVANYKHRVGRSLKPKLIKPGKIIVRLKSEMFEADVAAGEDPSLLKEEIDFRGREFDKQFACRFREVSSSDRGTFGKVIVERHNVSGNEPLFEFNLNKTGNEGKDALPENSDRWSMVAMKELAGNLEITKDNNWKRFAKHVGFTKSEIAKLQYSADPFLSMVNMYQTRGGTPEEYVQALYAVSREIKVGSEGEKDDDRNLSPSTSKSSSWKRKFWPMNRSPATKWRDQDLDSDDSNNTASTSTSRKRRNPNSGSNGSGSSKRRRQFSDVSETMSSSQESLATEDQINDRRKLDDADLWEISSFINSLNWRALGRTLGLDECVLLNIEHAYKSTNFRECAYQMLVEWKGRKPKYCTYGNLYKALMKENMNSAAKQMSTMKLNEDANN